MNIYYVRYIIFTFGATQVWVSKNILTARDSRLHIYRLNVYRRCIIEQLLLARARFVAIMAAYLARSPVN